MNGIVLGNISQLRQFIAKAFFSLVLYLFSQTAFAAAISGSTSETDYDGNYSIVVTGGSTILGWWVTSDASWNSPNMFATGGTWSFSKGTGVYNYSLQITVESNCNPWYCDYSFPIVDTKKITVRAPYTPSSYGISPSTDYDGSFTFDWAGSSGTSYYQYREKLNSGGWSGWSSTGGSSYKNRSGKSAGTWYYQARACSAVGCSGASTTRSVVVSLPSTPTSYNPTTPDYDGSFTFDWTGATGATSFQYREKKNSGSWSGWSSTGGTSAKSLSGKSAGTWYYQARACSSVGCGSASTTRFVVVTAPSAPSTPTGPSTDYTGSYTVSWSNVAGETYYELRERINSGSWTTYNTGSSYSAALSGRSIGTWDYQARACNSIGCSAWSGTKTVTIAGPSSPNPYAINGASSENDYDGTINLSWSASTNGTITYKLYEKQGAGSYSLLTTTSSTSYSGARAVDTWNYYVISCNAVGCSDPNDSTVKTVIVTTPSVPTTTTPSTPNFSGGFTLDWTASTGATSYEYQQRVDAGAWSAATNTGAASEASIDGLTVGTWDFQVRAVSAVGNGAWSQSETVVVVFAPGAAGSISATTPDEFGEFDLSWPVISASTSYELQEKIGAGAFSEIQDSAALAANLTKAEIDTYGYQMRGCNAAGCGAWSSTESVFVDFPSPDGVVLDEYYGSIDGDIALNWTDANGSVAWYDIETTVDGDVDVIGTGSSNSYYEITGYSNGEVQIRVRACNDGAGAGDDCSGWSNAITTIVSIAETVTTTPSLTGGSATDTYTGLTADFNGSLSGSFAVAASGAATYSIPLELSPGTSGITPSLSLVYNSHGGGGIVGRGWSVAGLGGSVARCSLTQTQDSESHAVDYSTDDAFCLNGRRLVPTGTGTDSNGAYTEYRTELDGFQRIRSYGTAGNAPAEFRVWSQNGSVQYYGGTNGKLEGEGANSGQVSRWLLVSYTDNNDNAYVINYDEETNHADVRVSSIEYGSNATESINAYGKVVFDYSAFSNVIARYHAGSKSETQERLDKISVQVMKDGESTWSDVRQYALTYNEGLTVPDAGMARLTKVQLCAPTTSGTCGDATTFDWQTADDDFTVSTWSGHGVSTTHSLNQWADMDGDGLADYISSADTSATHVVSLSSSSTFSTNNWTAHAIGSKDFESLGDMNGDGLADYVTIDTDGTQYVSISTGTGYTTAASWNGATPGDHSFILDLDGDGRSDYLTSTGTSYSVNISTGTAYSSDQSWSGPNLTTIIASSTQSFSFQDMDKDGLIDIVVTDTSANSNTIYLNSGTTFASGSSYTIHSSHDIDGHWVDMNGDGYRDYVTVPSSGTTQYVSLWTGAAFVNSAWTGVAVGTSDMQAFHDMNGDGLADFITADDVGGTDGEYSVLMSKGTGYASAAVVWDGPIFTSTTGQFHFADIDGDGKIDIAMLESNGDVRVGINMSQPIHLMTSVTDGLGNATEIAYKPTTDTSVHTLLSDATYPQLDIATASHVVSQVTQPNGIGGDAVQNYTYTGFKFERGGRGSLGFKAVEVENINQKTRSVTTYSQTYPTIGRVLESATYITDVNDDGTFNDEQLMSESLITYASLDGVTQTSGPDIGYVCVDTRQTKQYDLDGAGGTSGLLVTTFSDNDPNDTGTACDTYGRATITSVLTTDHTNSDATHEVESTRTYNHDTTNWFIGQLTHQIVKQFDDSVGDTATDREQSYTYNSLNQLATTVREPNQSAPIKLTTAYAYDDFGNRSSETVTPSEGGAATRVESVVYDSRGRFPTTITNALSHASTFEYDELFGLVTEIDGPNSGTFDVTTRTYDVFGRLLTETRPDGTIESREYRKVGGSATGIGDRSEAAIMVESIVTNGTTSDQFAPSRIYMDSFGRTIRTRTRAFDASNFLHSDSYYDSRGRVLKSSEPYFTGNTPRWNTPSYDVLARNVGLAAADPTLDSSVVFNDLGVTTTDAAGREREIVNNALGQTIRSYEIDDSSGGLAITQFDYSVVGNLERTSKYTLGGGSSEIAKTVATYSYDRLGRRLEMNDPDLGLIDTVYNSVGEVIQEQTPRLRAYSSSLYREMAYDKLSRLIERTDPTDDLSDVITTAYEYDDTYVSGVGIGQLTSETITDENSIVTFDRAYYYDSTIGGRMTDVATTIGAETFVTSRDYDDLGRLATVTYPVTPSYSTAFAVDYVYNPRGYLERVEDAATAEVLYQTTDVNEMGQIEENYLGDTSLTSRTYIPGTGRLIGTNAARDNSGIEDIQNLVYSYDALGNMSMRSDLLRAVSETFTYDDFNRLTSTSVDNGVDAVDVTDFDYDDLGSLTHKSDITTLTSSSMSYAMTGNAGTHALTSLNDGTTTQNFSYDTNGNLLTGDAGGNSRSMTWNSYDKVATITQGAVDHEFEYGPDRARYQHTANDGSGDDVTIYVESLYTRTEYNGGAEDHKLNVYVNGSVVAIVLDDEDTGTSSVENRYLHRDHLGSITAIVDGASGSNNIEWMAYDVFGQRRDAIDWIGAAATPTEVRGYTGHEHLDDVNIIHMNGRIYDPQLARMASPDPMLQDPMNSQNYNRYSYVMNNPLKYTDPTGYLTEMVIYGTPIPRFDSWDFDFTLFNQDFEHYAFDYNYDGGSAPASSVDSAPAGETDKMASTGGDTSTMAPETQPNVREPDPVLPEEEMIPQEHYAEVDNDGAYAIEGSGQEGESFLEFFGDRVMSGQVRDDIHGALMNTSTALDAVSVVTVGTPLTVPVQTFQLGVDVLSIATNPNLISVTAAGQNQASNALIDRIGVKNTKFGRFTIRVWESIDTVSSWMMGEAEKNAP